MYSIWGYATSYSDGCDGMQLFENELEATRSFIREVIQGGDKKNIDGWIEFIEDSDVTWDEIDDLLEKAFYEGIDPKEALVAANNLYLYWCEGGPEDIWWIFTDVQLPPPLFEMVNRYKLEDDPDSRHDIKLELADALLNIVGA